MSDLLINQNEQSREAERAVLGGLMLETQRFDTVIQVIKDSDFEGRDHQIIFESMSELVEENKPLDPITVSEKLDNKNSLRMFQYIKDHTTSNKCITILVSHNEEIIEFFEKNNILTLTDQSIIC